MALILTTENGWQSVLWGPIKEMEERVFSMALGSTSCLEIGPGGIPWPGATHWVDRPISNNPKATLVDVTTDPLPFADLQFGFVYCRHVLEDLWNPFLVMKEMARVAPRGYIEVPSPLAELCRGVDGRMSQHRGYHHHRWLIWEEEGVLNFLEKSVLLEHMHILDFRESILQTPSLAGSSAPGRSLESYRASPVRLFARPA